VKTLAFFFCPARAPGRTLATGKEVAMPQSTVSQVAHVIQLAVAPVFLLSGVGSLLSVLTSRLGRIIDRARHLETRLVSATPGEAEPMHVSLRTLSHRAQLISAAITLCTACALLICGVIVVLFMSAFIHPTLDKVSAFLFIAAMLALFAGLCFFLREIFVATAALRIGSH
jgi:hypothetical protein